MVFEDWYGASGYFGSCFDNGGGAALVCGPEVRDWRGLDLPNTALALSLNGTFVKEGFGRAAMGHPLTSLAWLVNWVVGNGRAVVPGEIISTGTCTGHCFVAPGDDVTLDVAGVGVVEAHFDD
jgi:2-keto-4-pentenoate hydratase